MGDITDWMFEHEVGDGSEGLAYAPRRHRPWSPVPPSRMDDRHLANAIAYWTRLSGPTEYLDQLKAERDRRATATSTATSGGE